MTFKNNITRTLYNYKVHHILFWICYFIFWVAIYANDYSHKGILFAVTAVYLVFHALAFYVTAYGLVPRFLYRQKVTLFIILSLLLVLFCGLGISSGLFVLTGERIISKMGGWWFTVFVLTLSTIMVAGILTAAKVITDRYQSRQQAKEIKQQNLETELKFLKAQINPHFLFNVINSIHVLINKDPDKASHALVKLSQMLRMQLYEFSDNTIKIEREIKYLKNYIELEQLRKGDEVAVHIQTDDNLNGFEVAPFLLISFLENAFKYVSGSDNRKKTVNVQLQRSDGTFKATFCNTTERKRDNDQELTEGIGIQNTKRRLNLLYPGRHQLQINQGKERFCVSLKLQLS